MFKSAFKSISKTFSDMGKSFEDMGKELDEQFKEFEDLEKELEAPAGDGETVTIKKETKTDGSVTITKTITRTKVTKK